MKITAEQMELVHACATAEELLEKAAAAGFELTAEQAAGLIAGTEEVEMVSASGEVCPKCGGTNISKCSFSGDAGQMASCADCHHVWSL